MTSSRRKRTASVESRLQRLEERHRALIGEIAVLGLVLRGTIAPRMNRCGNLTCRCKADPPTLHGPYPVWTRKIAGKTVTVVLRPEHATLCQDWNHNMHNLDRIVRQMQALGLQAAELLRQS